MLAGRFVVFVIRGLEPRRLDRVLERFVSGERRSRLLERDLLSKAILQFIKKGYVHYTEIEKKTVATCLRFATSNMFRKQFCGYLLPNGYVQRVSRGIYKITPKGEKLLELLR